MDLRRRRVCRPMVLTVLLAAATSEAAVTVLNYYRLGDDDPGAVAGGAGNVATVDAVGGKDLTRFGELTYTSNTTYAGSALAARFPGGAYYSGAPTNALLDNWGVEASVYLEHLPAGISTIAYDGGGATGYGLEIRNGYWGVLVQSKLGLNSGVFAQSHRWVHLAAVCTNGIVTVYVDGVAKASGSAVPNAPSSQFVIGNGGLRGRIDEVRLFTFTPGTFDPAVDLLANSTRAPDPPPLAVEAWYRFGEDDAGAIPGGGGAATTVDRVIGRNLGRNGAPVYSADVPSRLGPASTLALDSRVGGYSGTFVLPIDNVGFEFWLKPFTNAGNQIFFYNGGSDGFGLGTWGSSTNWYIFMQGVSFFDTGVPVAVGQWANVAGIRTNGVWQLYINGVPRGLTTASAPKPTSGAMSIANCNGLLDEARLFTVDPSMFVPKRDLFLQGPAGMLVSVR